jgi:hypothetical protein
MISRINQSIPLNHTQHLMTRLELSFAQLCLEVILSSASLRINNFYPPIALITNKSINGTTNENTITISSSGFYHFLTEEVQ